MYTKFYNFKERPFSVTPDARFFYSSPIHREALDSLYYAVVERRGFAVLTGDIGTGKTTVWRTLIKRLDKKIKTAVITNTHLTSKQLVGVLLDEMDILTHSVSKAQMISKLNKYLIEQFSEGNTVVLIVDEAQNLSPTTLEEIRMLSNLETDEEKLLQILLIGQPEFMDKLAQKELSQLRQRISVTVQLRPLTREEADGYIKFRINKVSQDGYRDIFTPRAIDKIYEYSKGVPRLINTICDGSLLVGFANGQHTIDENTVDSSIEEFLSFTCMMNK